MYVINICELVITFSSTKKSESKKSLIHFFTFALFYKWEKKNHLWKGFKVGKDNRGFKVLRRELFSFGARISKVQRRGGGNRGFC